MTTTDTPGLPTPLVDSGDRVNAAAAVRAMRWLMGEPGHALPGDRALAMRLRNALPWAVRSLELQRQFLFRSTELFRRRLGIDQFITFSAGPYRPWPGLAADLQLPCTAVPDAAAFVHVNVLTATGESGHPCGHRHTDARFTKMLPLLRHPALTELDRHRPIGVLVDDIGPLTASTADLQFGLDRLREWLPPGSAIALVHSTTGLLPTAGRAAVEARRDFAARLVTQATGRPYRLRSRAEIAQLLKPWPPGNLDQPVAAGNFFSDGLAQLPDHHSGAYAVMALHSLHPDYAKDPNYTPGGPTRGAERSVPEQGTGGEQAGAS
ncbi:SAM-dependent methyltransferase [Streptomyces microflavus]|uniref:SAM-dependent methyltransferase n=1 Tax=Streptomyces microflavus TaxID=1919 RepID=UPI00382A642E